MGTIESRKLFRAPVTLKVTYETIRKPSVKGTFLTGNLSSSGVLVVGPERLEVNEEIMLRLFLRKETLPISIHAKVIWQKPCQYLPKSQKKYFSLGLKFLDMSSEDAIIASDFIYEVVKFQSEKEEEGIIEQFEKFGQNP